MLNIPQAVTHKLNN